MEVEVKGQDLEGAYRRLRRMIEKDGVMRTLRSKEAYRKPSVQRRDKHRRALARLRRSQVRQENLRNRRAHDHSEDQTGGQSNLRRSISDDRT